MFSKRIALTIFVQYINTMLFPFEKQIISLTVPLSLGVMMIFLTKAARRMESFQTQFLFQLLGIPLLLVLFPFVPTNQHLNIPLLIGLGVWETFVLTLYFYAVKIGNLVIVSSVFETYVLVTTFLAVFFLGESLHFTKIAGTGAILAGIILLGLNLEDRVKGNNPTLYKGVSPALLSAIGTGIYLFFVGISSRINGWYYTALGIRIVMPLTILGFFWFQKRSLKKIFVGVPWKLIIPAAILDVVGFSAFNIATARYEVSYVTIMSAVAPIATVTLAYFFLGEKLKLYQLAGFVLVMVGVVSLNLG